ncbi:MAG TPA: AsmA family protein [Burkholderiales bacterium]|nr:AsmA family protein [Burkholderiales bacterium]
MKNIFKYGFFALGGLVVVVLAIVAYIAATFDPNQYKPQIVQLVKEKQQRTLKIDGDIKLSFFPSIGVNLPKLALSEHQSDKEFAAVDSARVSLKLMPLLSKQVVVDEVEVKGLRANLIRHKDGHTNIDDLINAGEAKPGAKAEAKPGAPQFDIGHVDIENTTLVYTDEGSGAKYTLRDVHLKTGRIANGTPGQIEAAFNVSGNQPKFDLNIRLKTRLTFDLAGQNYLLEAFDLALKGEAAGITKLAINAAGNVGAKLQSKEFSVDKLKLSVTGVKDKDNLDVSLDAPKINLAQEKFSGDKVVLLAKMSGQNNATAHLTVSALQGTQQAFKTGAINLELDAKQGEQTLKAKLSTPLSGNLKDMQFNLPAIAANFTVSGPGLPNKSVSGELKGSAAIDAAKEHVQAILSGRLEDSSLKAKLGVAGFARPVINFDLDIDKLDVDRYLPQKTAEAAPAAKPAETNQPEKPIDLSALKNLNANGSLRVGNLKVANVKAAQVRVDLKAVNGKIDINPLAANLYQGSVNGSIGINAAATPAFTVKQNLKGISIGPLLKDAANYDALEGKGNLSLDVVTQGATVSALKKALNGKAALNLADGAVKGINIGETIRNFKSKLGALKGQQTQAADKSQKTDFTELKASFDIRNGVAHNDDLSMKSPLLRLTGSGDINIGEDSLNYLAKASIVESGKGQGGADISSLKGVTIPVRVSGPFKAPQYSLDFGAAATEVVKQKAEEAVKSKLQDKLKGLLK